MIYKIEMKNIYYYSTIKNISIIDIEDIPGRLYNHIEVKDCLDNFGCFSTRDVVYFNSDYIGQESTQYKHFSKLVTKYLREQKLNFILNDL